MIIIVCGGRDYTDREAGFARIDAVHSGPHGPITGVVEGRASGGDAIGRAWSLQRLGKDSRGFPAAWDDLTAPGAVIRRRRDGTRYNVKAGFDRNERMARESGAGGVVALPGGTGTADMVARAKAAGMLEL